jgi:aldose 1-epimerase
LQRDGKAVRHHPPVTVVLTAGRARLAIDAARGGRIASLAIDAIELVVGPPDDRDTGFGWGCFPMVPWAGRIADGRLEWRGQRHQLRRTLGGHAIHGVAFDRAWDVVEATATEAVLRCGLGPAGWPFGGLADQRFVLTPHGLSVSLEVAAERAMPVVVGWHPWFRTNGADPTVALAADETLELDALIPTGRRVPVDERTDLRSGAGIEGRALDDVYPDVRAPVVIDWPGLRLDIALDRRPATFVVYTPGEAFCVEPQTGWPNAIALAARGVRGTGVVELAAGERFATTMTWRWSSTEARRDRRVTPR